MIALQTARLTSRPVCTADAAALFSAYASDRLVATYLTWVTEALSAAVAWARTTQRLHRLWAVCDVDNRASARVMEKSGLVFEGVLRRWAIHPNIADVPRDCACYAATW
ncbi:MAG: GNAT family protein [Acetobacteraceae bacterium]